ncbi:cilia- and flagella-associated protein 46 [Pelobates fuscus]|uniref:cilia- and flagella-associated protein 46 n=1 Tax=Pelobates fuscus TaxID=191477 RepID=UPI002FE493CD
MDLIIRQHLSTAENQQDTAALLKAYKLIKAANSDRLPGDGLENFSPDLYVLCAEQALQFENHVVSTDCLHMYFKCQPPQNQFYGRAYLCKGQLHAPKSSNVEDLDKSVAYYLKAIYFAKQQQRYYFLVYNASVLYWQMVRPFLKTGSRHLLISSLTVVLKALEEINERDADWRAELMVELLECMLEAEKNKEAADYAPVVAEYIKANVPHKYPHLFSKMVHHKLIDSAKAVKETKISVTLSFIQKFQKLRSQLDSGLTAKEIHVNLNDAYKLMSTFEEEASSPLQVSEKIDLLIELARLSIDLKCGQIAASCLEDLKSTEITDPQTFLILECLHSELEVLNLGTRIALYTKSAVESQLKVIQKLDSTLQNAIRLADPNIIQTVCTTQWNLCLPLLQRNLRRNLRKPLIAISQSLKKIDSLLFELRCQIHLEIAHIEEDEDRIEAAIEHIQNALLLNDNGQYQNYLKAFLHRLQLRATLYQKPERLEDQATMIIEQAKQCNSKDPVRKKRCLLVKAGMCLAPDVFQMVLDSENEARVATGKGNRGSISFLCLRAEHHAKCVQKTEGHLRRLENKDDRERVRLWAELAKVARKQEVWDVCRAACRFCLLYDDGRWNVTKYDVLQKKKSTANSADEEKPLGLEIQSPKPNIITYSDERAILRTLAEIRFINAEATIHLLKSEGCRLNDPSKAPEDSSVHPMTYIAKNVEENPEWIIYRNWISNLSKYATDNFLQAAELGRELQESWITHNAAVYMLNHNKHLLVAGRVSELTDTFQKLLAALKETGHHGNPTLFLMLSNAIAKGLIHPWIPVSSVSKSPEINPQSAKGKKPPRKGSGKSHMGNMPIDPNGLPDVKLALEICDYALDLTNGNKPEEVVPMSMRQQIISTWVKAKQLLQLQIGQKLGTDDEENNEGQNPMTRVLVAVEMHACNGLGLMDFTVPSLSQVFTKASECVWSDSLVELQTFTRLAHFAFKARDRALALTCTQKALPFDKKTSPKKPQSCSSALELEMLSVAACIQGQCIMDNLAGNKQSRLSAIRSFQLSARYAGDAGSPTLAIKAAHHYWYACLPLTKSPKEREPLKEATLSVIKALNEVESNRKKGSENDITYLHLWPSMDVQSHADESDRPKGTGQESGHSNEELCLRASLFELLFNIYADKNDWGSGLKVLDEAINVLPRTKHRLNIFKHRVLVKARLGQNFFMDIQKFKDESEDYVAFMWHHVTLTSKNTAEQLACFQNAIDALQKPENQWQKVEYILELAQWLYCNQFPVTNGLILLEWAVDILMQIKFNGETEEAGKSLKEKTKTRAKYSLKKGHSEDSTVAKSEPVEVLSSTLEDLTNVRQLEALARAYTLMAFIGGHISPQHEQHCLVAYACIMRIWKVSMAAAGSFIKALPKNPPPVQNPQSASSRKEKSKKDVPEKIVKEKSKRKGPIDVLPSNTKEWAGFDCPDEIRDAFKLDLSGHVINRNAILNPTYSLYYLDLLVKVLHGISLTHLTLPVLHLADIIAHDVVASKSLSDLYHLRISLVCADLKLYQAATYHEKTVGNVFISEREQISCRLKISQMMEEKEDAIQSDLGNKYQHIDTKPKILRLDEDEKELSGLSLPYLWIEKAEVLMELGYLQPARLLLSEAYQSFQAFGDKYYQLKCLYLLSLLANIEKNYGQAKVLLMEDQQTERDAEIWYKATLSMTEAILGENKEGSEKRACMIFETTISTFKTMLQKQSNRKSEYGFFIASLYARKCSILTQTFKSGINAGKTSSQTVAMLLDICDKMSQIEIDLLQCGHREYQAEFMLEHSDVLRILANLAEDGERKHRYFLDAYGIAESAVRILERILYNIQNLFPLNEAGGISLPIMRKLAKAKLHLTELSLEIIQLQSVEENVKLQEQRRKGHLCVAVEEFVRATPDYNSVEQEWTTLGRTVGSKALVQMASILPLIASCPDLKAKCLYLTGKSLYLLSLKIEPLNKEMYWNENFLDEKRKAAINNDDGLELPSGDLQLTSRQQDQLKKKSVELQRKRAIAQQFLAQASEISLQSISCAMNNNLMTTLAAASLQISLCLGRFDPVAAGQFLALYQSCSTSMMIKDLLCRAMYNTSNSQFAALLHLHKCLQEKGNLGSLYKSIEQRLCATSKAWEQLQISTTFFNVINEMPPNFNIIVLQHSGDRSFLYGAVLEKSKANSAQKGKFIQHKGMSAQVAGCAVDPAMFVNLLDRMELFKQDMLQILHKREYQQSFTRRKNVFENIQEINNNSGMKDDDLLEDENKLFSAFTDIVHDMEKYLNPVLQKFDFSSFRQMSPLLSVTEPGRVKSRQREEKPSTPSCSSVELGDCILLLADPLLMELPLEALSMFKEEGISSVSRDFSLQLLYNRIHKEQQPADGDVKRDVKTPKDPKSKAEQKKNIKHVPTNRVLPPNCMSVDTHQFKYIVDPYNEAREPEAYKPSSKIIEILGKYSQQYTPNWEGIIGSSRVPSHAEWETLMTNCSAFLFYGTERFLAHILLDRFVAINFTECQLLVLLDMVRTHHSFSRISMADVQKSASFVALERPVETAMLFSVSGFRAVMLNQWFTTLEQNAKKIDFLAENLLEHGKTTGQTVQSSRQPGRDPEPVTGINIDDNMPKVKQEDVSLSLCDLKHTPENPSIFRYVLYGLPNLIVM